MLGVPQLSGTCEPPRTLQLRNPSRSRPFRSGRRAEEVKKIKIENLYNHFGEPNNEVITLPTEIVKSRKEPEIVIINENIKKVLNSCEEHRSKPEFAKLKFVPWLFPNPHFALEKFGDVEFCRSEKTRYHYLSDVWKLIEKDTGIQGAPIQS